MAWCQHEIGRYAEAERVSSQGLERHRRSGPDRQHPPAGVANGHPIPVGPMGETLEDLAAMQTLLGDRREDLPTSRRAFVAPSTGRVFNSAIIIFAATNDRWLV